MPNAKCKKGLETTDLIAAARGIRRRRFLHSSFFILHSAFTLSRIGLLITSLATAPSAFAANADLERIVDETLAAPVLEQRFAGVVLIRKDGRTLARKAYGLADHSHSLANTPATPFMIMSVSKQFTAALILRLVARGQLGLGDRVSDYLSDWPLEWDRVTIHDLLSHSAGTDIDTTYFWLVKHHPQYWPNAAESPPPYEPRPLRFEPGTTFVYSNVGYTLLSMIASLAGDKAFDTLMREEVFCPLGITHTEPERSGVRLPGRARGHRHRVNGLELWEQKTIDIVGAGDLVSTADDLARFDERIDSDRFLPPSLRALMFSSHPPKKEWARTWGPMLRRSEIGYGWFLQTTDDGQPMQFHTGSGAGFRALNVRFPRSGLVIVILSNVVSEGPSVAFDLVERVRQAVETSP